MTDVNYVVLEFRSKNLDPDIAEALIALFEIINNDKSTIEVRLDSTIYGVNENESSGVEIV